MTKDMVNSMGKMVLLLRVIEVCDSEPRSMSKVQELLRTNPNVVKSALKRLVDSGVLEILQRSRYKKRKPCSGRFEYEHKYFALPLDIGYDPASKYVTVYCTTSQGREMLVHWKAVRLMLISTMKSSANDTFLIT